MTLVPNHIVVCSRVLYVGSGGIETDLINLGDTGSNPLFVEFVWQQSMGQQVIKADKQAPAKTIGCVRCFEELVGSRPSDLGR